MDNRQIDKDLRKDASVIRLKGLDVAEMLEEIQAHAVEIDIELPESFEDQAGFLMVIHGAECCNE